MSLEKDIAKFYPKNYKKGEILLRLKNINIKNINQFNLLLDLIVKEFVSGYPIIEFKEEKKNLFEKKIKKSVLNILEKIKGIVTVKDYREKVINLIRKSMKNISRLQIKIGLRSF